MNLKIPKFFIVLNLAAAIAFSANGQLQDVTAASGGYFQGNSVSVSFTVGETFISTLGNSNLMVTQGFQQPRLYVTAVNEIIGLTVNIQAFPNPVTDYLKLVTSEPLQRGSSYQLFNMNGSLVEEKQLGGSITEISFQSLVSATYLLKVTQNAQTLKTFKIIKK
jgi:hypothetical protein